MTATMTKTDRALTRAWDKAARTSDHDALASLRLAFEALFPVDVKLTARIVERLDDEYCEAQPFTILGKTRVVFHDADDADGAADALESGADQAVDFALGDVMTDLSDAQEAFLERQVRASIKGAAKKLRAAARKVRARSVI